MSRESASLRLTSSCLGPAAALLLLGLLTPHPSKAQTVQGQLLETGTEQPLQGALVLLLDEAGEVQDGYLTNDAGRFILRAPRTGRYTVRAERIGYRTVTSEPFEVADDELVRVHLQTPPSPIRLAGFQVEGEQRCVVRPEEGLVLAQVWEELRKALTVQKWTEDEGFYHFQLVEYEREMDPKTRLVVAEDRKLIQSVTRNPIQSIPIANLLEGGFIQPDESGGFYFYGPDATVLLSDAFLDTHCFHLEVDAQRHRMLGLSFQPLRPTARPDIRGTLWLDRETARLQFLEYGYTWSPWVEATGVAGGRVQFEELPNGAWIIRRWWIRMPKMVWDLGVARAGVSRLRVGGIAEAGGEVTQISSPQNRQIRPGSTGALRGRVWDSIRPGPLANATVYLSGTQYSALTDSSGMFVMEDLPQGFYRVSFTHPHIDSLGVYPSGEEVSITASGETDVALAVPSEESILRAICLENEWEEGTSAVVGAVRSGQSGDVISGARVVLEWTDYDVVAGRDIQADVQTLEALTDARGRFRACGIPAGALVSLWVGLSDRKAGETEFTAPREAVVILDLTVEKLRHSG
ncbi:carboxypeptidase regulatory-like domain-containing protein [Gemmatimonadota bacterium]